MEQTLYFIVNSKARTGKGIGIWNELELLLKERTVNYKAYRTKSAGHAKLLAEKITASNEERSIIIVGGDGTVNEVLNGINDFSKVKFGYIPIGSANDLALGLGINHQTPQQRLEMILNNVHEEPVDLGKVTTTNGECYYFAISSGIGIDAEVSKAALDSKLKTFLNRIHLGALTYKLITLQKLCTMPHVEASIVIDNEDKKSIHKAIFVAAMNQPVEGGGVPMAPHATARDGKLTLCCVNGYSKVGGFFALPSLLASKHEGKKGFWIQDFQKAVITLENPLVLHADGEYCGTHKQIVFECLPGEMKLI